MNDARLPRILSLLVAGASLSLTLAALGGCDGGGRPDTTDATLAAGEAGAPDDELADRGSGDDDELADDAAGDSADDAERAEDVPPPAPQFTAEQLEQMVAPIALYPDALLMEILMAATYPAEVAEAAAWAKEHPGLNGKALDDAIADKGWDVSVNSLVHAPKALELMAADPQWTRDLGDAFLAQQDDVLNAVQVMRSKACDAGTLKTTEQQEVIIEEAPPRPAEPAPGPVVVAPPPRIVRIVPVQPNVFYVPVYNPRVVYGPPPPVIYYPRAYLYPSITVGVAPVISFGVGLTIGALLWSDADWYYGRAYRHHHYYDHRHDYYRYGQPPRGDYWWHDHNHRRHVEYRSNDVERYYRSSSRDGRRDYDRDRDRYSDRMRDGRDGGDRRDGRDGRDSRYDGRRDLDGARDGSRDRSQQMDRDRAGDRDRDRDRVHRDAQDRSKGDARDKAQKATRDRPPSDSKGRPPGDSRGDRSGGKPDEKSSKGPGRIEDRSKGGAPGSPGVSGKGPGSGRPDKGQAVRPDRSPKQGAPSYRPQGGDKRGGSSSQRPSGGGGSAYRPQGGDKRGGAPSQRPPGGGGSSVRSQGGDKRGGSSMQQGGRSGGSPSSRGGSGGGSSRGGGQQQKGGGKSQRGGGGGDDGKGGKGGR